MDRIHVEAPLLAYGPQQISVTAFTRIDIKEVQLTYTN
jgi:hypothetical protein